MVDTMRRLLVAVVLGTALSAGLGHAQTRRPTAEVTPVVASENHVAGATARLLLRVTLPAGLHVQSDKPRDPDLIPTVLTIEPPKGTTLVDIVYPKAVDFNQEGAKEPLLVFGDQFDIVVRLKLSPDLAAGPLVVPGRLRYQACNDTICFIPARAETAWKFTVAAK